MFIANKTLTREWTAVSEANTGEEFLIQNLSSEEVFCYCVLNEKPSEDVIGGYIDPHQQLSFKKVDGDLYMKKTKGDEYVARICIEKVEA